MIGTYIMLELMEVHTAPAYRHALSRQSPSPVSPGRSAAAELLMNRLIACINLCGPPETAGPLLLAT